MNLGNKQPAWAATTEPCFVSVAALAADGIVSGRKTSSRCLTHMWLRVEVARKQGLPTLFSLSVTGHWCRVTVDEKAVSLSRILVQSTLGRTAGRIVVAVAEPIESVLTLHCPNRFLSSPQADHRLTHGPFGFKGNTYRHTE